MKENGDAKMSLFTKIHLRHVKDAIVEPEVK
jgi:hypothetical protein